MKTNHMNLLCLLIIALCYINSSEAAQCSPYTGPSGARQCIKLPGFTDYQWATCHTDTYIKLKTGHKHGCLHPLYKYCLYQCMLEKYSRESGVVYSSCRCTPSPPTTASPPIKEGKCNVYTGPSGARQCVRFSGFNDYQWGTCRTDAYIRSKNNGSHYCRNDYCLYQCMVEMYGRRSGDVYSSCRCTPNPATTVSPPTTASPQIKVGTCSPYTGPSGARQCIKLPGFTDYQWVTCRTDSYLRSKGHFCRNHFHTYCLYQCMLEKYSRESGVVYSSCRCTPSSPNNKVGGENSASQNEKYTFVFVVFVAISSLFVS